MPVVYKTKVITIGYTNAFDEDAIRVYVWPKEYTKQEAIEFVRKQAKQYHVVFSKEEEEELKNHGTAMIGRLHYFIMYPDEQRRLAKTLVKELL